MSVLSIGLLALTFLPTTFSAPLDNHQLSQKRAPSATNTTIVQLFQWPWDSIASECTDFLGPFGYGYAQVSPPQDSITGTEWWTDYQPVDYTIYSKRGTRDQFQTMVETCNAAGVEILVDAVINHMTAGSGTSLAGSSYSKYSYPDYTSDDFHYCSGSSAKDISDYENSTDVWYCELESLADLKSESSTVESTIAGYLNDLSSNLGVAGFRVDAAKHQPPANLSAIFSLVDDYSSLYVTQEVIYGAGEAVQPDMYTSIGDVQLFQGTTDLERMFTTDGAAYLITPTPFGEAWGDGYLASDVANLFVANHDTERGSTSLNYLSSDNAYTLAHVFLLGWNYATPTVLSGYNFSSTDDGPPQNSSTFTSDVTCYEDGWRCEHRWPAIANMVGFKNAVGDAAVTSNTTEGDNRLAFGRGEIGYVAINNEADEWSTTFSTSLPDGSYCDVIHATIDGSTVTCGTSYTIASGSFTADIAAYDALALYVGGP